MEYVVLGGKSHQEGECIIESFDLLCSVTRKARSFVRAVYRFQNANPDPLCLVRFAIFNDTGNQHDKQSQYSDLKHLEPKRHDLSGDPAEENK